MHTIAKTLRAALTAVALLAPAAALAQDTLYPSWYGGLLGGYAAPDSARDTDGGPQAEVLFGFAVGEGIGVELNAFGQRTTRTLDETDENAYGGGLDLVLGLPERGQLLFLLGGGAIQEDILDTSVTSGYANVGLGAYLPFALGSEFWRLEVRYNAIFNDESVPDQTMLEDIRVGIGVVFSDLSEEDMRSAKTDSDSDGVSDRFDQCADTPLGVNPDTRGCPTDLDGDGVPDGLDQCPDSRPDAQVDPYGCLRKPDADNDGVADETDRCPDTPRWVRPNSDGCTADSDGDGVDEARDRCPDTPAGTRVDAKGCDAAEVAVVADATGDKDGDTVVNSRDRCPHTPAGIGVDDRGCLHVDTVVLQSVHFELESDALKPATYRLVHGVAETLLADSHLRVEIGGHTDATGSDRLNRRLATQRAEVVRDFLSYLGVDESRMTVAAYGSRKPVADNKTEEGRARNRRVEFRVLEP